MFGILILISVLTVIACWFVAGFSLYSILIVIPVICFISRKVGYHIKFSSIVAFEVILLFLHFTLMFIFVEIKWLQLLFLLLIRAVFIITVLYDDTAYVYVSEERKR